MQQLKVIFPTDVNLNTSGIYKLNFSNGYFYFGSTKNFKTRFQIFKFVLLHPEKLHSKKMRKCLIGCKCVSFEVVEIVSDLNTLRDRETAIIANSIGNEFLINRSGDGNSNKGIRWTDEERKKVSKRMKTKYKTGELKPIAYKFSSSFKERPVIMMDIFGKELQSFPSLTKAATFIGSCPESITNQIQGKSAKIKHHKGYTFKYA